MYSIQYIYILYLFVDLSEIHHLLHRSLSDQSKHFHISTLTNPKCPTIGHKKKEHVKDDDDII